MASTLAARSDARDALDAGGDLNAAKYAVLREVFGFDGFRAGQEEAVDTLLSGRNLLAVMPTGAGKSLCFQVPALVKGGLTIVVSPLVALMQDQVSALKLAGVAADAIHSGQSREDNVAVWRRAASGELNLLYMAPERLMTERMLAAIGKLDVSLFAIDEAHCVSQWGPAFRPEYEDLRRLREVFPGVPVAALTATADEVTRADIAQKLFGGDVDVQVLGFDRPNIQLSVETKTSWKDQLLGFLDRRGSDTGNGIIYCLSRKKTEETAALLRQNGYNALPYHAGMTKEEREANQRAFMAEENLVMVATIAFGMGIDKPDVRFVVHVDLPGSLEAYYQEIGRAGRDGEPAEAHMLFGPGDIRMRRKFIDDEDAGPERQRREHQRLNALLAYADAPQCRRRMLLSYFGETATPCGNCDNCLNPADLTDGTEMAMSALSAIRDTGERYGAAHIIDIMLGEETEKVLAVKHDRLPAFGEGAQLKKPDWQSLIRQLVSGGYLEVDVGGYGSLIITALGEKLSAGEEEFLYRADSHEKKTAKRKRVSDAEKLTPEEDRLFTKLKSLRLDIAQERGVPAYVVFSDKTLIDMARRAPTTRDAFAEVHGVGAAKLKEFAEPFLGLIRGAG